MLKAKKNHRNMERAADKISSISAKAIAKEKAIFYKLKIKVW